MPDNLITNFISLFDQTEVPALYGLWSGIAGVSALVGRRVYFELGRLTLFPNTCIVLVAASGQKKSTPINAMEDLLNKLPPEIKPNIVPNDATPQLLVQAMNKKTNGTLIFGDTSEGFGFFSEFGTFLHKGAYEGAMPSLLIDLIDCRTYNKGTILRGIEQVKNPCFGFIGGTTVDYVRSVIPEGALGGGLASRFIFVHVEGRADPCVIPPFDDPRTIQSLLRECLRLSSLEGKMSWSDEVFAAHHLEYNRFYTKSPFWNSPSLLGYAQRRDKHLLKLAMIFALAAGSMRIEIGHYEAALGLLYKSENIMPRVMQKITSSTEGNKTEMILELISREDNEGISRTSLLRQVINLMNSNELTQILTSLQHSGQVKQTSSGSSDFHYRIIK